MQSWTSTGCFSNWTGSFVNNCRFSPIIDGVAATSHNLASSSSLASWVGQWKNNVSLNVEGPHYTRARGALDPWYTNYRIGRDAGDGPSPLYTDLEGMRDQRNMNGWNIHVASYMGNVSWSIGCSIKPINKRWVFYRTRGCGNQLNRRWLL